ncbi:hypothetical protein ColKHC_06596 [Colletotrichum higginsianum]|nr:hypothetical protein ColKHC_06596 [Colletotrichum higginsianum]
MDEPQKEMTEKKVAPPTNQRQNDGTVLPDIPVDALKEPFPGATVLEVVAWLRRLFLYRGLAINESAPFYCPWDGTELRHVVT